MSAARDVARDNPWVAVSIVLVPIAAIANVLSGNFLAAFLFALSGVWMVIAVLALRQRDSLGSDVLLLTRQRSDLQFENMRLTEKLAHTKKEHNL